MKTSITFFVFLHEDELDRKSLINVENLSEYKFEWN